MAPTSVTSPADVPAYFRTGSASRSTNTSTPSIATTTVRNGGANDSVDLSALATALKGNALTMFNEALGDEDRRKLDDAVRAGTLTGDEVAKGLTTRLKRIGFAQSGVDVATVDFDSEAANRALGGAVLLQRGQRRSDTPTRRHSRTIPRSASTNLRHRPPRRRAGTLRPTPTSSPLRMVATMRQRRSPISAST
ncbi:hypothetical protein [Azospirillum brasilense]|uniref:hypothetical protein n=1 Tax=Azospirillum brasilense TaxID=192 RepID=UPI001EDA689E|nr:hypothetical protein [Azospirillum brasilense]UKJ75358.1 hypothetical protein H1Q64_13945 [Azospirillum brasilense]